MFNIVKTQVASPADLTLLYFSVGHTFFAVPNRKVRRVFQRGKKNWIVQTLSLEIKKVLESQEMLLLCRTAG